MPYLTIIAALALFGGGYFTSNKINESEIISLKSAIEASNIAAENVLKDTRQAVETANIQAEALRDQLNEKDAQNAKIIDDYTSQLANIKLYSAPNRKSCANTLPSRASAKELADEAIDARFSEYVDRVIKEKAKIADETANYANLCWQFVTANCGIKETK